MRPGFLITGLAVLNVVLYSALLPLWEGFDEPFHFGYVQYVANGWGMPDARTMYLSNEVKASLLLAPASAAVQLNVPAVRTYSEYFSWPPEQRLLARKQLNEIPSTARWTNSDYLNYEAQHPPLAYALLAVPERALSSLALPQRVLVLRILAGLSGILLLYSGMRRLYADLGLPETHSNAAIFCVLSCQMTWATIAHVANDWLAVPLTIWLLSMLIRFRRNLTIGSGAQMAVVAAAGLLTKAYFLALLPVVLVTCLCTKKWKSLGVVVGVLLLVAGPWYGRNLTKYGTLSGMQEARSGITLPTIAKAASRLDWPALAVRNARRALWTGNNTFRSFSTQTLNLLLVLLFCAIILWAARGAHDLPEWLTVAHLLAFSAALGYSTALNFVYTRGAADGPSPWYSQVLLPPLFGLAFLGCSRAGASGRALGCALVTLSAYILAATYFVKLIPLYAGFADRMSMTMLMARYTNGITPLLGNLGAVSLAPSRIVLGLAFAVTALAGTQAVATVRSLVLTRHHPSDSLQ